MISHTIDDNLVSVSAHTLPGSKDEDRFNLVKNVDNNIYAVSLFDGHNGYSGAQLGSETFITGVINILSSTLKGIPDADENTVDAYFCDTVYKVSKELNRNIKNRSKSGTTLNALFVRKLADGSYSVYCVNIGNSRCIFTCADIVVPMSEDHSLKTIREQMRIKAHEMAEWYVTPLYYLTLFFT